MDETLKEKEQKAIERLQLFEPQDEPYYLCYSGGKDSDCIRILAELAGVNYELHHNLTTVDAPETVQYVKSIPNIIIDKARYKDGTHKTMWNLIVKNKIPPTRYMRYCCSQLKEPGGKGKLKITGVRAGESAKRKKNNGIVNVIGKPKTMQKNAEKMGVDYDIKNKNSLVLNYDNNNSRRFVEYCYRTTSTSVNPILDWTEEDVWNFLNYYDCKSNPLYECGFKRVGCIGCPMASKKVRAEEFERYPKYYNMYLNAFDKMLKARDEKENKEKSWNTAEEVMEWYLS